MIVLNEIYQEVGKGLAKRVVLEDISWEIQPRSKTVILGHRGSGKSMLLNIIAGVSIPTRGWVERRMKIVPSIGFLRYGRNLSPHALIGRLSEIYGADAQEITRFIENVLPVREVMKLPIKQLPKQLRGQLDRAIVFALPGDAYLFDGGIEIGPNREFRNFCYQAFQKRCAQSSVIVATSSTKVALRYASSFVGAILYQGKLRICGDVEQAIDLFNRMPPDTISSPSADVEESDNGQEDEDTLL